MYGEDAAKYTRVVAEVENIGPGISPRPRGRPARRLVRDRLQARPDRGRDPDVDHRHRGRVRGRTSEESGYDREIELSTDGSAITGLDGGATSGERIEFALTNDADAVRILELKSPDGSVAGEVQVDAGTTGEVVIDLDAPGTWQVIVEGEGRDDLVAELPVS